MASNDSERRPVIGITTYTERTQFGCWNVPAAVLPRTYPDSVVRTGGVPVLLPPIGNGFAELVGRLDGLLLAGGADVDPTRYDQSPHPETLDLRPDRDSYEFGLLTEALAVDLPTLAVCRGMQVLNSALGGTLRQHLPDVVGHQGHRPEPGTFGECRIRLHPGSRANEILGPETKVYCHHHQALDTTPNDLTVTGTADDGTIEAVELAGRTFVLGVQWHPEQDNSDDRLVAALIKSARTRATRADTRANRVEQSSTGPKESR